MEWSSNQGSSQSRSQSQEPQARRFTKDTPRKRKSRSHSNMHNEPEYVKNSISSASSIVPRDNNLNIQFDPDYVDHRRETQHGVIWIHPSHRGTNYRFKPKKKKIVKRQRQKQADWQGFGRFQNVGVEDEEARRRMEEESQSQSQSQTPDGTPDGDGEESDNTHGGAFAQLRRLTDESDESYNIRMQKFLEEQEAEKLRIQQLEEEDDEWYIDSQGVRRRKVARKRRLNKGAWDKDDASQRSTTKRSYEIPDYHKLAKEDEIITADGQQIENEIFFDPSKIIFPKDYHMDHEESNDVRPLSYQRVQIHKYRYHPRDRENVKKFNCCKDEIGHFPIFIASINKDEWVTPCAKEIGLGPSLFLMTMKAFTWLFIFLAVINIPFMLIYLGGNTQGNIEAPDLQKQQDRVSSVLSGNEQDYIQDAEDDQSSLLNYFGKLSLGNLGQSEYTCSSINVANNERTFSFACPYGTMREMFNFGLQKIDNQTCQSSIGEYLGESNDQTNKIGEDSHILQVGCNIDDITETGKYEMELEFANKCFEQTYCEMDIKYSWFNRECRNRIEYYAAGSMFDKYAKAKGWHYYQRDDSRREPVIFGISFCVADKIYSPFSGQPFNMRKDEFAYYLLFVDFFVVIVTVLFINWLERRYIQYCHYFDLKNVEMRDFCVEFSNLPYDFQYGHKEILLQCFMWNHVELNVKKAFEKRAIANNDADLLHKIRQEKPWEILDVTFGKNNNTEIELISEMDILDREEKKLIHEVKMRQRKNMEQSVALDNKIIKLIREYNKLKAKYIKYIDEIIYDTTQQDDKIVPVATDADRSIKYAYVTFRSMKGRDKCLDIFKYADQFAKTDPDENKKMLFDHFMKVKKPSSPGSIKWENVGYGPCNRCLRSSIIWIVAFFVLVGAFYIQIRIQEVNDEMSFDTQITNKCGKLEITTEDALDDFKKPPKQRQGFGHCFCVSVYKENNGNIDRAYEIFLKSDPTTETNHCQAWVYYYENKETVLILAGVAMSLINTVIIMIFEKIVWFEKCLTHEDEIKAQFSRICVVQFLNIGCLLLFVEFNLGYKVDGEEFLPIFQGTYRDFDTEWYYTVGSTITMSMLINCFSPFAGRIIGPIVTGGTRCITDRSCKKHLLKLRNLPPKPKEKVVYEKDQDKASYEEEEESEEQGGSMQREGGNESFRDPQDNLSEASQTQNQYDPNDPNAIGDDEPETKLFFQDELNELYTNPLCLVYYMYAWFFTNLIIFYMYGGGMPLMYWFGILFFTLFYWIYKFLFLDFYRISYGFNETIPMYSVHIMKFAIIAHLAMNLFMYTNKRLLTPEDYNTEIHYRPPFTTFSELFINRYDTSANFTVLIFTLVILVLYLVWRLMIQVILRSCKIQQEKKRIQEEENPQMQAEDDCDPEDGEEHSSDLLKELKIIDLKDLYIRANKDYQMFRSMINAISYDQELLSDDYAKHFKKKLKIKIINIEDTIDVHLSTIGALEMLLDKTYMYKLSVLNLNEEKIKMENPKCLRIVDQIQSYHSNDAFDYMKTKLLLQRIDRHILELDYMDEVNPVFYEGGQGQEGEQKGKGKEKKRVKRGLIKKQNNQMKQ